MLGVAVLIIVQSVMNGFSEEIRSKIVATFGHVRVESRDLIEDPNELLRRLRELPEVAKANVYAEGLVMLQHDNRPAFPFVRGIDVMAEEQVTPIDPFMLVGNLAELDDGSVILSSQLAATLGASRGSMVDVYSPLMLEMLKHDEVLLPLELEVAGIFETGYGAVDSNTLIVTLRTMRELYGLGRGAHGVALRLHDGVDPDSFARALGRDLEPPLRALSWLDANQDLLFVLQLEKNVMFFIILFIILVASFSIANSLLTSVVRKTREIGLLAAMGGRPRHMALVYALQGFMIGLVGTSLGVLFAVVALHFRNDIVRAFARLTESEAALIRFYQFVELPLHYSTRDLLIITLSAILISTLAGLLPAWRAARLKPSEALRNE